MWLDLPFILLAYIVIAADSKKIKNLEIAQRSNQIPDRVIAGFITVNSEIPTNISEYLSDFSHIVIGYLAPCGAVSSKEHDLLCKGKNDFQVTLSNPNSTFSNDLFQDREPPQQEYLSKLLQAKDSLPNLRTLINLGGYSYSSMFRKMNDLNNRKIFVESVAEFLNNNTNIEGILFNWYGTQYGDSETYLSILRDLRNVTARLSNSTGKQYELSSISEPTEAQISYIDYTQAMTLVDKFYLRSFNYIGGWQHTCLGHHSPLFPRSFELCTRRYNTDFSVQTLVSNGVSVSQIVVGIPYFGQGWNDVTKFTNPFLGFALKGRPEESYKKIQDLIHKEGWQYNYDIDAKSAYIIKKGTFLDQLITYNDVETIKEKSKYIKENHLAGVFVSDLTQDNGDLTKAVVDSLRISEL